MKGHGRAVRQPKQLASALRHQIDDIYLQLDSHLTRLAEIQLQFAELRSKSRHL